MQKRKRQNTAASKLVTHSFPHTKSSSARIEFRSVCQISLGWSTKWLLGSWCFWSSLPLRHHLGSLKTGLHQESYCRVWCVWTRRKNVQRSNRFRHHVASGRTCCISAFSASDYLSCAVYLMCFAICVIIVCILFDTPLKEIPMWTDTVSAISTISFRLCLSHILLSWLCCWYELLFVKLKTCLNPI